MGNYPIAGKGGWGGENNNIKAPLFFKDGLRGERAPTFMDIVVY
jgi:hypothetical protein